MKKPKQIPLPIHSMVSQVMHYGVISYDKEREENGTYYRTRVYHLDGYTYEVVQRDGELVIFQFINSPD